MSYPNFEAPSPQEIYDGLKMIPNSPQGKQMLSQLAQQGRQTGSIEGGIATALLNSYNKMQPPTPPPQGQVVDQVIAQAQPPMNPNMLGLAMPGLEDVAQQNMQQMATGGIVALADGGPVRGFDWGGVADLAEDSPWMQGMPQVPEAPDTTAIEADYLAEPEAAPEVVPEAAPTRRTVTAGESPKHSIDEQIDRLGQLYDAPPDILAEMISRREHAAAKREKMNVFETIASGLSGYLSSYGSGAHRAGAGLASMLGTMGAQQKQAAEDEATLEGYRYKAAMQPYEIHKDLVNQVLTAQTAQQKAESAARLKMWEKKYERESELMKGQQVGEYGLRREAAQGATSREVAEINKQARIEAAIKEGLSGGDRRSLYNSILQLAADEVIEPDEIESYFNDALRRVGGTDGMPEAQTPATMGKPVQLNTKGGMFTGWLK